MEEADLSYADLSGVNLRGANLRGATLSRADLSGAILMFTVFGAVDLSDVKGLETVTHQGL